PTITLREAINYDTAHGGGAIIFDNDVFNTPQTINLAFGQLELSHTETILGPAAGLTVSGGGLSRVFQVDAGVTAFLSGLTITGGSADNGGGLVNHGTLTLTNCTLSGNSASHSGGGLWNNGTLTLTNGTVSGNLAAGNTASTTTVSDTPSSLYVDNFDSASVNAAWKFVGGTWSQSGGLLRQTSTGNADPRKALLVDQTYPTDVQITAR